MSNVLSAVAWPYANGPRHIGHVAGFGVPSDVFSRYMRMAGHDVLMVSGTDEHGTPILVAADEEGVTPAGARRQVQRGHRRGPRRPRPVLRPLHPHDDAQPLRRRAGDVPPVHAQRLHGRADDAAARSARRPGAPCPTATSRAPARSAATPRPAATSATTAATSSTPTDLINPRSEDQRRDAGVRRDPALLPRPAGARRRARRVARRARGVGHVAAQRHQVLPEPPRGHPPARDDPRHRLGHPGPARRLARTTRPSGSTSGSTPSSATSRRRSSGRAASATPSAGASGGTTRRPLSYYFMGKDNITFHCQIWPAELLGYAGPGRPGRRAGRVRRRSTCRPRSSRASS